jgi:hypothetical protein
MCYQVGMWNDMELHDTLVTINNIRKLISWSYGSLKMTHNHTLRVAQKKHLWFEILELII